MNLLGIKQVIIWGHKLHSSAHSYIHYGFYKAFKELGYKTLWLENNENNENNIIDYSDTLFIVEGQEDKHIPIINECYYLLDYETSDINLVGSLSAEWYSARFYCFLNGFKFNFFSGKKIDFKENEILIQNSYIAPAIQTEFQINQRYITSRIFKNISYGKMGLTNNQVVAELFDGNIIYNNDISKLLELGVEYEKNTDKNLKKAKILFLMEYVKEKHTYINRVKSIFKCLNLMSS